MGTPTEENWPGHTTLPDYVQFKTYPPTPLEDIFTAAGPDLLDLLQGLVSLDPNARCTCSQALKKAYFSNKPAPTPGANLPMPSDLRDRDGGDGNAVKDLNFGPGNPGAKRKMREGMESSGLAKKLVF